MEHKAQQERKEATVHRDLLEHKVVLVRKVQRAPRVTMELLVPQVLRVNKDPPEQEQLVQRAQPELKVNKDQQVQEELVRIVSLQRAQLVGKPERHLMEQLAIQLNSELPQQVRQSLVQLKLIVLEQLFTYHC